MDMLGTNTLGLLSQILEQLGYTTRQQSNLLHVELHLPEDASMVSLVEVENQVNDVVFRVRTKVPDDLIEVMATPAVNQLAVLGALHTDDHGDLWVGSRVNISSDEVEDGLGLHLVAAGIHYNLNGMIRAMILSRPAPLTAPEVAWTEDEFTWAGDQLARLTPAESKGQSLRAVFLIDEVPTNFAINGHFHPGLEDGLFSLTQLGMEGSEHQADALNHWEMSHTQGPPHLGAWVCRRGTLCYVAFYPNQVYHKGLLERLGPWAMERTRGALEFLRQTTQASL